MSLAPPRSSPFQPGVLLRRLLALLLLAALIPLLLRFPVLVPWLVLGLVLYLVLLQRDPDAWLVVVPAALPLLQLAPWSGWLFVDAFDALLLCTLAAGLWHGGHAGQPRPTPGGWLVLALLALLAAIGCWRGLGGGWPQLDANALVSYYSPLNALRLTKGLVWALLLYPLWLAARGRDAAGAERRFVVGVLIGLLGVALVVLWERGVLHQLIFFEGPYALLGTLLDFSTAYRVTALFADMHVGGSAIDGYLSLTWPLALLALLAARTRWQGALAALVLLGTCYAMVVTFSRGVYLGFLVVVVAALLLGYWRQRRVLPHGVALRTLVALGGAAAMALWSFRSGGMLAMTCALLALVVAALPGWLAALGRGSRSLHGVALVLVAALAGLAAHGAATSKWTSLPLPLAMTIVASGVVLLAAIGWRLERDWGGRLALRQRVVVVMLWCVILGVFIPALFGTRMEARFAAAGSDLQARLTHWQQALALVPSDWSNRLLGLGAGRFPERYLWTRSEPQAFGTLGIATVAGNRYLRLSGARGMRLGQRVALHPNRAYRLRLAVRTAAPELKLQLRLCHRQLIAPSEWNPRCVTFSPVVTDTGGGWRPLEFVFDSANLGSFEQALRAPLLLTLANRREYRLLEQPQTLVDIDNVSLQPLEGGRELVRNGDFGQGIDHWLSYSDFDHQRWHTDNLWVHLLVERGVFGLGVLLLLLLVASRGLLSARLTSPGFGISVWLALLGFLAVGTFGTLLDAPRVALLFYLLALMGLPVATRRRRDVLERG
ncbi:hypothetical protein [Marichromatium bheemlicum]|uniref:Uncharacterized protein n=1 Tax=Marichromatium bheemlicum TaxID=365339 RepID=A0ABX1IAH8_9GAMM|nr:hypothetical protein [Marichromatium bheemlicum]NKN34049.1 hypothetical protein [Marichromatium bheemlicum]